MLTSTLRRHKLILFVYLLSISAVGPVYAQREPDAESQTAETASKNSGSGAGKRTTVNFEDQLVEGQAQKPEMFFMLQQRNANFKRLIRFRDNFLPEMRKTSEDISSRKGSAP